MSYGGRGVSILPLAVEMRTAFLGAQEIKLATLHKSLSTQSQRWVNESQLHFHSCPSAFAYLFHSPPTCALFAFDFPQSQPTAARQLQALALHLPRDRSTVHTAHKGQRTGKS